MTLPSPLQNWSMSIAASSPMFMVWSVIMLWSVMLSMVWSVMLWLVWSPIVGVVVLCAGRNKGRESVSCEPGGGEKITGLADTADPGSRQRLAESHSLCRKLARSLSLAMWRSKMKARQQEPHPATQGVPLQTHQAFRHCATHLAKFARAVSVLVRNGMHFYICLVYAGNCGRCPFLLVIAAPCGWYRTICGVCPSVSSFFDVTPHPVASRRPLKMQSDQGPGNGKNDVRLWGGDQSVAARFCRHRPGRRISRNRFFRVLMSSDRGFRTGEGT